MRKRRPTRWPAQFQDELPKPYRFLTGAARIEYHDDVKRWVFRISLVLILGAVTTVGITWGLGLREDRSFGFDTSYSHADGMRWSAQTLTAG